MGKEDKISSSISEANDLMKRSINNHGIMAGFAVLFIILAFIWAIGLCGLQTGSSETSGFGSVTSNINDNPTYEVVVETLVIILLIIGVAMIAYVLTLNNAVKKLVQNNQYQGALILSPSNDIKQSDLESAETATIYTTLKNKLNLTAEQTKALLAKAMEKGEKEEENSEKED